MRRTRHPSDCYKILPRFWAHIRRVTRKHKVAVLHHVWAWVLGQVQGVQTCSLCVPIPQLLTTSGKSQQAEDGASPRVMVLSACKWEAFTQCWLTAAPQLPPCSGSDLLSSFHVLFPCPGKGQALAVARFKIRVWSSADKCTLMTNCQ